MKIKNSIKLFAILSFALAMSGYVKATDREVGEVSTDPTVIATATPPYISNSGSIFNYPSANRGLGSQHLQLTLPAASKYKTELLTGSAAELAMDETELETGAVLNLNLGSQFRPRYNFDPMGQVQTFCGFNYIEESSPINSFGSNTNFLGDMNAIAEMYKPQPLCDIQASSTDQISLQCSCVALQTNPNGEHMINNLGRLSNYQDIEPEVAQQVCQESVNSGLIRQFGKAISSYTNTAVIGELLSIAGKSGVTCNSESMKHRFKDTFGVIDGGEQRECSAQSVAYIIGQIESGGSDCDPTDSAAKTRCLLPQAIAEKAIHSQGDARSLTLEGLLQETRGLAPVSDPSQIEPDQVRKNLRVKYESFIAESELGDSYASLIDEEFKKALGATLNLDEDTARSTNLENLKNQVAEQSDLKSKIAKAIINYVVKLPAGDEQKEVLLGKMSLAGFPSIERLANGSEQLSEEQAERMLNNLNNDVINACNATVDQMVQGCKILTPGSLFNTAAKNEAVCGDSLVRGNPLLSSSMDYETWLGLASTKSDPSEFAAVHQFMCLQHFQGGGLRIEGKSEACNNRDPVTGAFTSLSEGYADSGKLEKEFLSTSSKHEEAKVARASSAFRSCSPFSSIANPNVSNTLLDERAPFSADWKEITETLNDGVATQNQQNRNAAANGNMDPEDRVRAVRALAGSSNGDSRNAEQRLTGSGDPYNDLREDARRDIINSAANSTANKAQEFYSSDNERRIEEMTSTFTSEYNSSAANNSARSRTDGSEQEIAQEQLDQVKRDQARNDSLLAQLDELRTRNEDLLKRLQEQNITEIVDENGEKKSVIGAFEATRDRIAKQEALAMQERAEIERREIEAQRAVAESRNNQNNLPTNSRVSSTAPSINPTPERSPSSSNSNSSSRAPASISGASASGGGGGSGNSAASRNYGPAPFEGIVLTAEEFSIAKPELDLGGRTLNDSSELVRVAISAVKSELEQRNIRLPKYNLNGKIISEYILQEQDGKTVIVYLDGENVKVEEVDFSLSATQAVVEAQPVVEEVEEIVPEAVREPASIENQGRKRWSEVEDLLQESKE